MKMIADFERGIKTLGSRCPCVLPDKEESIQETEDLICPCRAFREEKKCICNLWKVEE